MTSTLQRFSGYTYSSLMREDAELIRLMEIEYAARAADLAEGGENAWPT